MEKSKGEPIWTIFLKPYIWISFSFGFIYGFVAPVFILACGEAGTWCTSMSAAAPLIPGAYIAGLFWNVSFLHGEVNILRILIPTGLVMGSFFTMVTILFRFLMEGILTKFAKKGTE